MLDPISNLLGRILEFFYGIVPNAGIAIILLTITVRLVMFPLTAKQAKSMIAMQRVQPEIKKLQAKYKDDRQKLNEEMMKFYKENQINPLGGCLPLLIQAPILFALFQTLRVPEKYISEGSEMFNDLCNGAKVVATCKNASLEFVAGLDITESASNAAKGGLGSAWPYLVLMAFVVVTGFIQQRQTMKNQTNPNPQMAVIAKVFPLLFAFFTWGVPSGVALYWGVSNVWQIGQQQLVINRYGTGTGPAPTKRGAQAEIEGSGTGPAAKPGRATGTATKAGKGTGSPKGSGGGKPSPSGGNKAKKSGGGSSGASTAKDKPTGSNAARSNRKRKR